MFRLSFPRFRCSRVVAQFLGSLLLAVPLTARSADLEVKIEPGVAVPLGSPQSDRFSIGGAGTVKGLAGPEGSWASFAVSLTFLGLPAKSGFNSMSGGTAWAPGIGFRIQQPRESEPLRLGKPHASEKFWGAKPWIDGDLLYVRTGGLDRAGFAAAVGVSFPIGEARSAWLGPFVRYMQIFQGNRSGYQNNDSKTIIAGLSLEFGTRVVRQPPAAEAAAAPVPAAVAVAAPATCPTCPAIVVDKVVIRPDKLEVKDKIQFLMDQAVLDTTSHSVLDQVAKVLRDNQGFKVQLEGHASSEGGEVRNQELSQQRAQAVLDYLADRGVARDRLLATGFSSSRPIESNVTEAGREANRRVDFVVSFIILKEESAK
jgi:outer membrane protein OmpA-like peptidoglycan-associated protein